VAGGFIQQLDLLAPRPFGPPQVVLGQHVLGPVETADHDRVLEPEWSGRRTDRPLVDGTVDELGTQHELDHQMARRRLGDRSPVQRLPDQLPHLRLGVRVVIRRAERH
jgi:hypothetical protein